MAYGDLPMGAPHKPNKGKEGGACNRERCQAEPALWYNHGSYSWYCEDCAKAIGNDPVNYRCWMFDWYPRLGHPQFETREMMDARESVATDAKPRAPDNPISKAFVYEKDIPEQQSYKAASAKPKTHPRSPRERGGR